MKFDLFSLGASAYVAGGAVARGQAYGAVLWVLLAVFFATQVLKDAKVPR